MRNRLIGQWGSIVAVLALTLPSCSSTEQDEGAFGRVSSAIENPPPASTATSFAFDLIYPAGTSATTVTIAVSEGLTLADHVKIQEPTGGLSTITALGPLTVGNDVTLDNAVTVGSMVLGDRVKATLLKSGGTIRPGNQDIIGKSISNADESPYARKTVSVNFPATSSGNVLLNAGETKTLAPGRYGSVVVGSTARLKLTSGEYYFESLLLESQSKVDVDNSNGALAKLFVRNNISAFRGAVTAVDPSHLQIVYLGTNTPNIEAPFQGVLIAPYARLQIGNGTPATFLVSVFAKSVSLGAGALVKHLQFSPLDATPIISTTTTQPTFTPPSTDPIIQSRPVAIDVTKLQGKNNQVLGLDLFANAAFRAIGKRIERNGTNGWVWLGQVENQPTSTVTLSVRNNVVSGGVYAKIGGAWHAYRIRYAGNGVHAVQETQVSQLGDDGAFDGIPGSTPTGTGGLNGTGETADPCSGTDNGQSIDAAVGYTTAVRTKLGGTDAAVAMVYEGVAAANESYINSGITQRLRVVDVREYSYTESGSDATDVSDLQAQNGGFSNVLTVRNSSGADVVGIITNGTYCGRTYDIPSTVSTSWENIAYMVTGVDCASSAGKWSLAHEFGHEMAARHDWYVSSADNQPYHYNHGFVDTTNLFRTVMGYSNACTAVGKTCDRVLYWSSPDVKYSGNPTGIADNGTNPQPSNNVLTLNNYAPTVANYRCSSPGTSTVWMRDTWNDTGKEPDPATATDTMYESPYIWVRNAQDTSLTHQHQHENPINGQTNWVYVKLHNGAGTDEAGTLRLYWANASAGLSWPSDWHDLGSTALTVNKHSTKVAEIQWPNLPGTGHFCLLARWVAPSDPLHDEGTDIESNVRKNNKIIWHNVNILSPNSDENMDASFNMIGRNETYALQIAPSPTETNGSFFMYGQVVAQLDTTALNTWIANGKQGQGFRYDQDSKKIVVTDLAGAVLKGIPLPTQGEGNGVYPVALHMTRPASTPARAFHVQVTQYVVKKPNPDAGPPDIELRDSGYNPTADFDDSYVRVGGVTYEVRPTNP